MADIKTICEEHLAILSAKLGVFDLKLGARDCVVSEDIPEYRYFCENFHLQGYAPAKRKIGLRSRATGELLQLISLSHDRWRRDSDRTELVRLITRPGVSITGGVKKLLSRVSGDIVSYCDPRYSSGGVYSRCGFELINWTIPGYVYVRGADVVSRYRAQRHLLPALLGEIFDSSKTEEENMASAGYNRLYDAGQLVFFKREQLI